MQEEPSRPPSGSGLRERGGPREVPAVSHEGRSTLKLASCPSSGLWTELRKDVREFIRRLEAVGLTVEATPGHYRVQGKPLRKANGMPFTLPFSPHDPLATSRDRRATQARHRPVELRRNAEARRPFRSPATTAIRSHRTPAPVKHDVRSALGRGPLGARLRSLGTACAVGCGDAQSSPGLRVRQGWSSGAAELVRARVYKERAHASRAFAGRLDTERAALVWLWKVGQPEPHGFCPSLLIDHARGLKIHGALEGSRRSDSLQSEGALNDDLGMMMPLKPAVQADLPPTREAAEVAAADADCPTGRRDLCADPRKPVGEPNRSGRALMAFLLEPFRSSKRFRSKHAIDCQTAAKPGTQPLVGWVS
jgi:hypothetical protein